MTANPASGGGTWLGSNVPVTYTTTTTNGSVYISTTPNYGSYPYPSVYPTLPTSYPPFATNPLDGLLVPAGPGKLTAPQLDQLLREHAFIEMAGSEFCLFCYALDLYKTRLDHIFVINEE
jgi:hypothetical protein